MTADDFGELSETEKAIIDFGTRAPEKLKQLNDLIQETIVEKAAARRTDGYATKLQRAHRSFVEKFHFSEGQLVQWKPDLKNKRRPEYGEPAVVVSLLDPPVLATSESAGSSYFRESLDLIIGMLDQQDEEFITFHVDSRRFRPIGGGSDQ